MLWSLGLCVFWFTLWGLTKLLDLSSFKVNGKPMSTSQDLDLRNRFISICHSHVALSCVTYFFLTEKIECGSLNTYFQRTVMTYSMTFFGTDIITMTLDGLADTDMVIHHILCVFGQFLPLYENIMGDYTMLALFFTEISNPLMTYRHLLRNTGRRYTIAYEICEVGFVVTYMFSRLVAMIPTVISTHYCDKNHIIFKISCYGLFL